MSKTIKVIDLLNKIANGEEFPKRIKTNNRIYHYCTSWDTYEDEKEKVIVIPINKYCLNDTVEIIEEQEEIDIQNIEKIEDIFIENSSCGEDVKYLARKYNEILKWAKQVDKKIKEK